MSSDWHPVREKGTKAKVISNYLAAQADHLELYIGDVVELEYECEDWYMGTLISDNVSKNGCFPKNIVTLADAAFEDLRVKNLTQKVKSELPRVSDTRKLKQMKSISQKLNNVIHNLESVIIPGLGVDRNQSLIASEEAFNDLQKTLDDPMNNTVEMRNAHPNVPLIHSHDRNDLVGFYESMQDESKATKKKNKTTDHPETLYAIKVLFKTAQMKDEVKQNLMAVIYLASSTSEQPISLSYRLENYCSALLKQGLIFTDLTREHFDHSIFLVMIIHETLANSLHKPYGVIVKEIFQGRKGNAINGSVTETGSSVQRAYFHELNDSLAWEKVASGIRDKEKERNEVSKTESGKFIELLEVSKHQIEYKKLETEPNSAIAKGCVLIRSRCMPSMVLIDYDRNDMVIKLESFQYPKKKEKTGLLDVEIFLCHSDGTRANYHGLAPGKGEKVGSKVYNSSSSKARYPFLWREYFSIKFPHPNEGNKLKDFPCYLEFRVRKHDSKNAFKVIGNGFLKIFPHDSLQLNANNEYRIIIRQDEQSPDKIQQHVTPQASDSVLTVSTMLNSMHYTNNEPIYTILNHEKHQSKLENSIKNFSMPNIVPQYEIQKFSQRLLIAILKQFTNEFSDAYIDHCAVALLALMHVFNSSDLQQRQYHQFLLSDELSTLFIPQRNSSCPGDLPSRLVHHVLVKKSKEEENPTMSGYLLMKVLPNVIKLITKLQRLCLKHKLTTLASTDFQDNMKEFFEYYEKVIIVRRSYDRSQLVECKLNMLSYVREIGSCIDDLKPVLLSEILLKHLTVILRHTEKTEDVLFTTISQNFLPPLIESEALFGDPCYETKLLPLVWDALHRSFRLNRLKLEKEEHVQRLGHADEMTERWCRYYRKFISRLCKHWQGITPNASKQINSLSSSSSSTITTTATTSTTTTTAAAALECEYDLVEPSSSNLTLLNDHLPSPTTITSNNVPLIETPMFKLRLALLKDNGGNMLRAIVEEYYFASEDLYQEEHKSAHETNAILKLQSSAIQSIVSTLAVSLLSVLPHLDSHEMWYSIMNLDTRTNNRNRSNNEEKRFSVHFCPSEELCDVCNNLNLSSTWDMVTELLDTFYKMSYWPPLPCKRDSIAATHGIRAYTTQNTLSDRVGATAEPIYGGSTHVSSWPIVSMQMSQIILDCLTHLYDILILPLFLRCSANKEWNHSCSLDVISDTSNSVILRLCNVLQAFTTQSHLNQEIGIDNQDIVGEATKQLRQACRIMEKLWKNLGEHKIVFIPAILKSVLYFTIADVGENRQAVVKILFEMMQLDFCVTEKMLISEFDQLLRQHVRKEMVEHLIRLFEQELLSVEKREKERARNLVELLIQQMRILLELNTCCSNNKVKLPLFMAMNHLMEFYVRVDREDLLERYHYTLMAILYDAGDTYRTERGYLCFELSKKLDWSDEPVPLTTINHLPSFLIDKNFHNGLTMADLKECLLKASLKDFETFDFELAIKVCEALRHHYKEDVDYSKLKTMLEKEASLYDKILESTIRVESKFALLTFCNSKNFPSYITAAHGQSLEALIELMDMDPDSLGIDVKAHTFVVRCLQSYDQEAIQTEFPNYHVTITPKDVSKFQDVIFLQTSSLKIQPEIPANMLNRRVNPKILRYYQKNQGHQFVKRTYKGQKREEAFVPCQEVTLETSKKFPNIFPVYAVTDCNMKNKDSLDTALDTLSETFQEMEEVYLNFHDNQTDFHQKMRDVFQKIVIANVQGGLLNYKQFVLRDDDDDPRLQDLVSKMQKLLSLLYDVMKEIKDINNENRKTLIQELERITNILAEHFSLNIDDLDFRRLFNDNVRREQKFTRQALNNTENDSFSMRSGESNTNPVLAHRISSVMDFNYSQNNLGIPEIPPRVPLQKPSSLDFMSSEPPPPPPSLFEKRVIPPRNTGGNAPPQPSPQNTSPTPLRIPHRVPNLLAPGVTKPPVPERPARSTLNSASRIDSSSDV